MSLILNPHRFAVSGGGAPAYYNMIIAETGLVSYYRMGEASGSLIDAMGSNDLTVTGSPTYSVTGALLDGDADTAITWAGNGTQRAILVGASGLPTGTTFSIEGWVNGSNTNGHLFGWGSAEMRHLIRWNGHIYFWGQGQDVDSGVDFSAGWNHVVVSCSAGSVRIYKNASLIAGPTAKTLGAVDSRIAVTDYGLAVGDSNGTIDEVAFYSVALSATQVSDHYAAAGY